MDCPSSRFGAIWTTYNETFIFQCKEKTVHEYILGEFHSHFWTLIRIALELFLKFFAAIIVAAFILGIGIRIVKISKQVYMKYIRPGHVETRPPIHV